MGYDIHVDFKAEEIGDIHVIAKIEYSPNSTAKESSELANAIGIRLTNRAND